MKTDYDMESYKLGRKAALSILALILETTLTIEELENDVAIMFDAKDGQFFKGGLITFIRRQNARPQE